MQAVADGEAGSSLIVRRSPVAGPSTPRPAHLPRSARRDPLRRRHDDGTDDLTPGGVSPDRGAGGAAPADRASTRSTRARSSVPRRPPGPSRVLGRAGHDRREHPRDHAGRPGADSGARRPTTSPASCGRRSAYFVDPETRWDTPYLGGETYRQLRERVWPFFERLMADPDWHRVVVVAHGGRQQRRDRPHPRHGRARARQHRAGFRGAQHHRRGRGAARPPAPELHRLRPRSRPASKSSSMDVLRGILETSLGSRRRPPRPAPERRRRCEFSFDRSKVCIDFARRRPLNSTLEPCLFSPPAAATAALCRPMTGVRAFCASSSMRASAENVPGDEEHIPTQEGQARERRRQAPRSSIAWSSSVASASTCPPATASSSVPIPPRSKRSTA